MSQDIEASADYAAGVKLSLTPSQSRHYSGCCQFQAIFESAFPCVCTCGRTYQVMKERIKDWSSRNYANLPHARL